MSRERPTSVEVMTRHDLEDNTQLRICWEVRFDDHIPLPYNWGARFKSARRIEAFSDDPGDIDMTEVSEDEAEELIDFSEAMEDAAEMADRKRGPRS